MYTTSVQGPSTPSYELPSCLAGQRGALHGGWDVYSLNIGNRSIVHASSERVREKFDWNCLVSNTYSYHLIERNVFAIASNNIEWNIENQTTNSWKYQTNIIYRTHLFPYRIQLLENIECNIRRIKQLFLSHTLFFHYRIKLFKIIEWNNFFIKYIVRLVNQFCYQRPVIFQGILHSKY